MSNEPATKHGKSRHRFFQWTDPAERFLSASIVLALNLIFVTAIFNALKWWSIPVYVVLLGWLVFCLRITPRQERKPIR